MARIEFRNLGHSYRPAPQHLSDYALQPMNRVWRDGGAYALLGPSGCGKSTLLNIISGLLTPSEGQVLFDGQDVTHASPRERNIAQVFQFPVIYDTMTVFDNLAFPLRNRKVPEAEVRQRVEEVAEILELQHALKRRASGLAADAKQKISLGRGLVRKDVAAILFDEPLTVIDPHLKWQLRRQLKKIHQQLKLTLIYVTHDQVEALTFADEVVVMTEGKVVQQGGPEALFKRPDHTFVGYFIGSPGMNLYPVTVDGDVIALGGQRLCVGRDTLAALKATSGPLKLGLRPEFVQLAAPGEVGTLAATVHQVQQLGTHQLLTASLGESGDLPIKAKLPNDVAVSASRVWLRVDAPQTLYYCNDERIGR
ncbi:ABC transporter ATP-binding protein [Ralstonia solanacearum]|uniref:ABC transporter ATP-binding protein n=1 Tax=Ralstonia solanacearum TaxID=305 RepID=UPI00078D7AAF|nr:ABC transporter ATP-binding protein [Ralstonia solanacearum]AMP36365.1 ABC transporter ATP-binding protein [Ralstonia solanacearum]AXV85158.1 ABC transporter ATP-binding protein [Ralstonia solanacearum]AXW04650.1 ABC transporter ATP-binding protein [Ralstonia solanacearum]AXW22403.1 ABC transporter ATP-binding protein [Ralstonia solanacearum]AXW79361.1 ABC transporter ATP-binding protein [Ralstonia solanacearum]